MFINFALNVVDRSFHAMFYKVHTTPLCSLICRTNIIGMFGIEYDNY
jgi:hypothetical protein